MQKIFPFWVGLVTVFFVLTSCAGRTAVREDLKTLPANVLMDRGAEQYSLYNYREAMRYYQAVIDFHPENHEEVAWARYEIGYIHYVERRYDEARKYIQAAVATPNAPRAVLILAELVLKKLPPSRQ